MRGGEDLSVSALKFSIRRRALLCSCAVAALCGTGREVFAASQNTWISSTSGNWSDGTKWLGGSPPAVDPTGDANLVFSAPGTYTANNDLGTFGVYNTSFNAGNGTTTLNGGDINLSYPLSENNNPTFTNNSTNPVVINNNVNIAAPPNVGTTPEYFTLHAGSTTTINGNFGLTGGSQMYINNGQINPGDANNTGGPGGTMIWTKPVVFTNSPNDGYGNQFDFRVFEGTFAIGGLTISDGYSDGSGVHNISGVNVLYGDGVNNGAITNMYIAPEDVINGHPNDVAAFDLIGAGAQFNSRVQIGAVGAGGSVTIGGLNTTGTVYFNDFFLTLPSNGNGIVNGLSQVINYSAAAGGTVVQNFQLIRGGAGGFCGASVDKVGAGTWIVTSGGTNPSGEQAYHGTTTVRDGTLELAYDDTGTNSVTLPAALFDSAGPAYPYTLNFASGTDGGSLGFNAPLNSNPALDANAVQLGDSGTSATDNIALLTLNNTGAPGPRTVLHNIVVNTQNSSGTTTIGVADNGTGNFTGNILMNKTAVLTGGTGGTANFSGVLNGSGGVTINGSGSVNLSAVDTYTGATSVNAGTLVIATTGSITSTAVTVGNGTTTGTLTFAANSGSTLARALASLNVSSTGLVTLPAGTAKTVLIDNGSYANAGKIDLFNNDMIVKAGGATTLAAITTQLKSGLNVGGSIWSGAAGIESTTAASDSQHLLAVGAIVNNNGGSLLYGTGGGIASSFDGQTSLGVNDVLVKLTYFGDANLDGKVDASDYTRIDSNVTTGGTKTGWYNGDFNYDGVVNGSDYTLIDNAFDRQGSQISNQIASVTAEVAGPSSAVPEPATLGLLGVASLGVLSRRRRADV